MRHVSAAVLCISLFTPSAVACVSIYVSVDLTVGGLCCPTPPVGSALWSNATVNCRDLFGNPWVSYMRLSHYIRDDFTAVSGRFLYATVADWHSNLFAESPEIGQCYRGTAEGDDNLGTSQSAGSAQICFSGPVMIDCDLDPSNPECRCELNPDWPQCRDGERENCPLILNTGGGPWRLTGTTAGVAFDIDADGVRERITWTAPNSPLEFIAMDDNSNGRIDDGGELFGNARRLIDGSIATNGFAALAEYDANFDHVIDQADPVWHDLLLWNDRNHNGLSEPAELRPLSGSNVHALEMVYINVGRKDQYGNEYRMMSHIETPQGRRPYFDVFFVRH